jgi:hypothetical protein
VRSPELLDEYYAEIERTLTVRLQPDYARLVVPNGNTAEPVHRWFHMKEAFSCQLLYRLLKNLELIGSGEVRILDPFCGVGTTLVSAVAAASSGDLNKPVVYGIERNPFLHLAAWAKAAALVAPHRDFMCFARSVAGEAYRDRTDYAMPLLSTFHNERYFNPSHVQDLLRLRAALKKREEHCDSPLPVALGLLALGACVEMSSRLRKDGRALRFVEREPGSPIDLFLERSRAIDDDMPLRPTSARVSAYCGDGVMMDRIDGRFAPFDLVVFSPPYPNNIDYTEVYKLENWLLGYIDSDAQFARQRMATMHSHPSLKRPHRIDTADVTEQVRDGLRTLTAPIIAALPEDRYHRGRVEVVEGYAVDMFLTACAARSRLRSGGKIVVVVGNSIHGDGSMSHVIAADLLIAQVARLAGLDVNEIAVARQLQRRGSSSAFLRESVIVATSGEEA